MKVTTLLADKETALLFKTYCQKKYCLENYSFWQEVQEYRSVNKEKDRLKKAFGIIDKYIGRDATNQINIDGSTCSAIEGIIEKREAPTNLFDEAEVKILLLMEMDVLPGFIKYQKENKSSSKTKKKRPELTPSQKHQLAALSPEQRNAYMYQIQHQKNKSKRSSKRPKSVHSERKPSQDFCVTKKTKSDPVY